MNSRLVSGSKKTCRVNSGPLLGVAKSDNIRGHVHGDPTALTASLALRLMPRVRTEARASSKLDNEGSFSLAAPDTQS